MKNTLLLTFVSLLFAITSNVLAQQKTIVNQSQNQVLIPFFDETAELYGYKDSVTQKVIIKPKYLDVLPFTEGMAAVYVGGEKKNDEYFGDYNSGGYWGYINTIGTLVIPAKYDFASVFINHSAIVAVSKAINDSVGTFKYGIINSKGIITAALQYDELDFAGNNLFYAYNSNQNSILISGVIDNTGSIRIPVKYSTVLLYGGYAVIEDNKKWGLSDLNNHLLVPVENKDVFYHEEEDFFQVVVTDDSSYYYHKSGVKFDTKEKYKNDVAIVSREKKYGLIDKNAKLLTPLKYNGIDIFYYARADQNNYIKVTQNGKCGYINTKGIELVPCRYEDLSYFENGLALAVLDKKYGYIDTTGKEIIPCRYDYLSSFEYGLALVKIENKYNYIDSVGKNIFPEMYDNMYECKNYPEIKQVKVNNKIGLINLKERKEITAPKYDWIGDFYKDVARVLIESTLDSVTKVFKGGKFGYVNLQGVEIIAPIYSEASYFENGIASVTLNGEKMEIGLDGKKHIKQYANICYAIQAKDIDAIKDMLAKGTDLNKEYEYQFDINTKSKAYPIAVLLKSKIENVSDLFKLFVEKGADINMKLYSYTTPITFLLMDDYYLTTVDVIKIFMVLDSNKYDFNAKNADGINAIYSICMSKYLFRSFGCDGTYEIAKFLLEHHSDPTAKDKDGRDALKIAKMTSCDDLVNLIKSYKK